MNTLIDNNPVVEVSITLEQLGILLDLVDYALRRQDRDTPAGSQHADALARIVGTLAEPYSNVTRQIEQARWEQLSQKKHSFAQAE